MAIERNHRVVPLLGFGEIGEGSNIAKLPDIDLISPAAKSVIVCCTAAVSEVGANTNWSCPPPPIRVSELPVAKITSLPAVPCRVILGPVPASLKMKFTVSVAPKLSATVSATCRSQAASSRDYR
jgi:hypothetical protein